MAQVDFEMRYKTQAIADLEDVVHQSQKEASARGLDALLAAADAQGEGEEAWVMKDAEAKGLLRECLKRVLLLEEVARKRDKEREALEMEVCVCVWGGVWRGGWLVVCPCVCACMCTGTSSYASVCAYIHACIDTHPTATRMQAAARGEEVASLEKALERMHLEAQRDAADRERKHQQDLQVYYPSLLCG